MSLGETFPATTGQLVGEHIFFLNDQWLPWSHWPVLNHT